MNYYQLSKVFKQHIDIIFELDMIMIEGFSEILKIK